MEAKDLEAPNAPTEEERALSEHLVALAEKAGALPHGAPAAPPLDEPLNPLLQRVTAVEEALAKGCPACKGETVLHNHLTPLRWRGRLAAPETLRELAAQEAALGITPPEEPEEPEALPALSPEWEAFMATLEEEEDE